MMDIHTDIVYSNTGYYVITYFRSEVTAKKNCRKYRLPTTVSGGISQEWFKLGSRNFTHLSRTISLTNVAEITSLPASGWHLSRLKKRPKTHPTALFALSLMQCQRRLEFLKWRISVFRIKQRGVSPSPTLWWASCWHTNTSLTKIHKLWD